MARRRYSSRKVRGTKRARGLGVIVEEHLEYRIPAKKSLEKIFWMGTNGLAFCTDTAEGYIRDAKIRLMRARIGAKDRELAQKIIDTMEAEYKALKPQVHGHKIPMCIVPHKTSEKATVYKGGYVNMQKHERFHARMRRAEQRVDVDRNVDPLGYDDYRDEFVKEFKKDFGDLGEKLIKLGHGFRFADNKRWVPEEILARVEEMIKACSLEAPDECGKSESLYRGYVNAYNNRNPTETLPQNAFEQLRDKIFQRYGSAIDYGESIAERIAKKRLAPAAKPRPARGAGVPKEYNVWEDEYQAPGAPAPAPRAPRAPRAATPRRAPAPRAPPPVAPPTAFDVDDDWEFVDDGGGVAAPPVFLRKLGGLALALGRR